MHKRIRRLIAGLTLATAAALGLLAAGHAMTPASDTTWAAPATPDDTTWVAPATSDVTPLDTTW